MLSTFPSGPTHSAVKPFVDPKLIQSVHSLSGPELKAHRTSLKHSTQRITVTTARLSLMDNTSVAGARKDPHRNSIRSTLPPYDSTFSDVVQPHGTCPDLGFLHTLGHTFGTRWKP